FANTYLSELERIRAAITNAQGRIEATVKSALKVAATARADTGAQALTEQETSAFEKEQVGSLNFRGEALKIRIRTGMEKDEPKENYDGWRTRVTALLKQTADSTRQTFLAAVEAKYGLTA